MRSGESQAAYDEEMVAIEQRIQTNLVTHFDQIRLSIAMALSITHLAIEREQRCAGAEMRRWMPRVHGFGPLTKFHDLLKSNQVGHFVAVRGNVVRVSGVRQKVVMMQWECSVCGLTTKKMLEGGCTAPRGCVARTASVRGGVTRWSRSAAKRRRSTGRWCGCRRATTTATSRTRGGRRAASSATSTRSVEAFDPLPDYRADISCVKCPFFSHVFCLTRSPLASLTPRNRISATASSRATP